MTFGGRLADAPRFQRIDETNRGDHWHVAADDECYFVFEYTSGQGYQFSATNQLISNLKKKPSQAQRPGYHYKRGAIWDCSRWLAGAINAAWLNGATLVPVPPSKAVGHADYDDRMVQICRGIPAAFAIDVRELVTQRESIDAAHESGANRPTVADLIALYQTDETLTAPTPQHIAVVDDVLTAGAHWRAMHHVLSERFPGVPIIGMFIARRVIPPQTSATSTFEHMAAGARLV
jgi:hypothetical protein